VAMAIIQHALQAVDPRAAVHRLLTREDNRLAIGRVSYDLASYRRVLVLGAGKASGAMAAALEELLDGYLDVGAVIVKQGYRVPTQRTELFEAGHPIPDQRGLEATQAIMALAADADEDDLIFFLVSGGCSALLEAPAPCLTLDDLVAVNTRLLSCGAAITEINTVRKHLSLVKGGKLAQLAAPATRVTLVLSDVVGSPLGVIGSGPTVADKSTPADALRVLDRYGLLREVPAAVLDHLHRPDTAAPEFASPARGSIHLVGSNEQASAAAASKATELGWRSMVLSTFLEGEAREVGRVLAAVGKEIRFHDRPLPPPACVVCGGETTVVVRGSGKGGRNQELALGAALALDGMEDVAVVGFATDGTDGPTDAAGAWADGTTVARGNGCGLDAAGCLAENDSYRYFQAVHDLITTGPTCTNVNDLALVLVW